jgi:uncharacterized membrane protein YccC
MATIVVVPLGGFWVDITIAVILAQYIVTTFERGVQRVVGTVLGCFLAAGLLAAVSGDVAVVAVLLALAFATFAVPPFNYGRAVLRRDRRWPFCCTRPARARPHRPAGRRPRARRAPHP